MRMLGARVNLQFPVHLFSKLGLGSMPWMASSTIRMGRAMRTMRALVSVNPPGISRMAAIKFLFFFSAGEPDLGGIDHHHVIARIDERRVLGLCLP